MKRQFRDKKFRARICIKYTDALGKKAIWEVEQHPFIDIVLSTAEAYAEAGHRLTSRQLYYQLVAADIIPNAMEVYKRVTDLVVDLRYAGRMDWAVIEDRGRTPSMPSQWDSVGDLIDSAVSSYRLSRWKDQDWYVELYCEKQALEAVLKPLAKKYHIFFGVNKGYTSASVMYDIAMRMDKKIDEGKMCVILYLGDHDPSGLDMVRDIQKRVCEFLGLEAEDNDYFNTVPIALTKEQIKQHKPPSNPAQRKDPRAAWYIRDHGVRSWELDALTPDVLIKLTEAAILKYLDVDKYLAWKKREYREIESLKSFGETLGE
jgi:hypothetical protein